MSGPYRLIYPQVARVPILISVPHSGTAFPAQLKGYYKADKINPPDDTDFFVEQLYEFATAMGITLIHAHYSRWVIDLNRSPDNQSLYHDGRLITDLTPVTDFLGESIYVKKEYEPFAAEIDRRKWLYYEPYYAKIEEQLTELQDEFDQVLFWDAHSIRRRVARIQAEAFPDFVLGSNDEQSAHPTLIQAAMDGLHSGDHTVTHNTPFKGGNLTRHFGQPELGRHALQLEMAKDLYMDDTETQYAEGRSAAVQKILHSTFQLLIQTLAELPTLVK